MTQRPRSKSWILSAALCIALAMLALSSQGQSRLGLGFFSLMAVFAALAVWLRFGWTIPCIVTGVLIGILYDAGPKGGTQESQMYETVFNVFGGAIAGMLLGLAIDLTRRKH